MTKVNILPVTNYPNKLKPLAELSFRKELYQRYEGSCYRIGDSLFVFGKDLNDVRDLQKKTLKYGNHQEENYKFSKLLRHLILHSVANGIDKKKFAIDNNFITSRLFIIKKEPSIENDNIRIKEKITLQTHHWKDTNYAIILQFGLKNEWKKEFIEEHGHIAPSYENIREYLSFKEANNLLRKKIPELRKEKQSGKFRGDALKQKFSKIKNLFKESVKWGNDYKEFHMPVEGKIEISDSFINVVPLG